MKLQLIKFEFIKVLKKPKTFLAVILLCSFISILMIINNNIDDNIKRNNISELDYKIESIEEAINKLPEDNNNSRIQNIRENYQKTNNLLKEQIETYKQDDWKNYLALQNEIDTNHLIALDKGEIIGGEPREQIETRLSINKELLAKNIRPVNEGVSTQGVHFLKNILNIFLGFMGILVFIFIVGDSLSNEYEKGTIKFLFTQPISRVRILTSKLLVTASIVFALITVISLFSFLLGSIFNGIGNLNYPTLIIRDGQVSFINLYVIISLSGILFIFVTIFILTLQFFFSLWTKSNILATGFTIILSSILYIGITQYGYFSNFAHLIPFSYFDTTNIVNGQLAQSLENRNLSLLSGIVSLFISSLVFFFASIILIKEKSAN